MGPICGVNDFHTPKKKKMKEKGKQSRGEAVQGGQRERVVGSWYQGQGARVSRSRKVQSEWQSAVRNASAEIIVK